VRKDLRTSDNPALAAALATGRPVVAVFIRDELVDRLGAAPKQRLEAGLKALVASYAELRVPLVMRSGSAQHVLEGLIDELGASGVYWGRQYDPEAIARDSAIKSTLKERGIEARSFGGHLLFEPWSIASKTGGFYKVYSPYWKAVRNLPVEAPLPKPKPVSQVNLTVPSDDLKDWNLSSAMNRGAAVMARYIKAGERAAQNRLAEFIEGQIGTYNSLRDFPSERGTSELSDYLAWGEISPHQCWHGAMRAFQSGVAEAEVFLKELVWREFAYHLMHHTPHILDQNWREEWGSFPWNENEDDPRVLAWKQGRTGEPFVDAAMRELYVTGRMHNRARMIVASYLTKHLLTHWRIGQKWFEDCLIDWDPASNAMGWQWAAGCGPDAAPYFRVFNPETQLTKFDPSGAYQQSWIAETSAKPSATALAYFEAVPKRWGLEPSARYPNALVDLKEGRLAALAAYSSYKDSSA
jgi:deoxyribodipyrimidine photo-lyase